MLLHDTLLESTVAQELSNAITKINSHSISDEEKEMQKKALLYKFLSDEMEIQFILQHLSIENLYSLRNIILTSGSATVFLAAVLMKETSYYPYPQQIAAHQDVLVRQAIALGADVNQPITSDFGVKNPLFYTKDKENLAKILQEHGAVCGRDSDIAQQFLIEHSAIFDAQRITARALNSLKALPQDSNKIPYIMHHVWLTHPDSPRELFAEDIEIVLKNAGILLQSKWQHIIWVNGRSLIPSSVEILESNDIAVESFIPYASSLPLFNEIMQAIDIKQWGIASDMLRYCIVDLFGGVYSDLNFALIRDIDSEMSTYDFFAQDSNNYFFAAKPNHPILGKVIELVKYELTEQSPYMQLIPADDIITKTMFISLIPFSTAYLYAANQFGNKDIILSICAQTPNGESYDCWVTENKMCPFNHGLLSKVTLLQQICVDYSKINTEIGEDGANGMELTWIENEHTPLLEL